MQKPPKAIESLIESIIEETTGLDITAQLGALGYPKSPRLADVLQKLTKTFCTDRASIELFSSIVIDFLNAPHPEGALINLSRYADIVGAPNVLLITLAQAGPLREILATTFGSSQYMADIVIRNPGYLYWLIEKQTWDQEESLTFFETELEREIAYFRTKKGKLNAVRRYHRMALLRIGVQDLLGQQSIESTSERLSHLADAIVNTVLEILWRDLIQHPLEQQTDSGQARRRRKLSNDSDSKVLPRPNTGFSVLALGKLGGRELNYSSDIDLIYLCADADDDVLAFYRTLSQSLTGALTEVTEEGYLYRIDLRLRPDGSSGPLVNSMTSMRIYYENRGKPWEFQAMLKARVIAGDRQLGETFLENISGLIYNPSLPYSPVEDIARMRVRIQENIPARERPFNIKLMEGGIRDIEFIVQTLQLLHGAGHPELRAPGTLDALDRAAKQRLLKKKEAKTLADAYRFLRLVEHRLQMMHQIKTHTVPESPQEVALLAARVSNGPLGSYAYAEFIDALTKHLKNVRILSESFFAEGSQDASSLLLLPETDAEALQMLESCGIADPERAIKVIHTMAYGSFPRLLDRNTRAAFADLLPHLLDVVSTTGDPGLTLTNVSRIAAAGRSEYALYKFLRESDGARALVVALAGVSSRLTDYLCSRIETLDALLVDPEDLIRASLDHQPVWEGFKRLDKKSMTDKDIVIGSLQKELRQALDRLHLASFLVDFEARSFPDRLAASRASFAKRSIADAFDSAFEEETQAALFAMGSFGVGEPRYGSDADLLVVSNVEDTEAITRNVQTINRVFTEGRIFKLDFRLRGEGANAPLVQDLQFYDNYFKNRMSLWERIAFSKCALWWGDQKIAHSFLGVLEGELTTPFAKNEIEPLLLMRRKLDVLGQKTGLTWETKRSPGGRYDIEYLCGIGIAKIAAAARFPFTAFTGERLDMLKEAGMLDKDESTVCKEALEFYSKLEYILELQGFAIPQSDERERYLESYVERTFDYLGFPLRVGIRDEIRSVKRAVRSIFERFIEKVA
ncbi:MAG: hypothetical protein GTO51_02730 [Candidatus Latescibacteria bacterium]|nr:hypothetical protein [Candidatus Latescibacterota bacterium]NIM22598.1 hypothetical protein [Candidatus Latescibacterota bacterium]NIM64887.1 hypothetical protein [Candidatus Latescibacterota bacterium]NIO01402.1 hypothetical protein [Candidatus Latescibacterota bacterium]NIO27912.1 hypothetical protein [Candidatus Latescibacterota bacterium]